MSVRVSPVDAWVSGYAARLHAVIGTRHHVASPLGAWLLLALAGPASTGADRAALTEVLGCDVDAAARAAADLLTNPHPLVASAAAVWTDPAAPLPEHLRGWRDGLPAAVTTGDLPGQAGLDAWARDHTFGLIDRFPIAGKDLYLVLASALATKSLLAGPVRAGAGCHPGRHEPVGGHTRPCAAYPGSTRRPRPVHRGQPAGR